MRALSFPRSIDRGLIEARGAAGGIAKAAPDFRDRSIAASLSFPCYDALRPDKGLFSSALSG
jgi:hypothetical protein